MGTTMQKIQAIADSKDAIKDAIEEQGVTVGDAKLSEYPSKIRAIQGGGTSDAVLYTPQTLTSSQQAQARENIGAEAQSNKVTSLSSSSTDTQYPSAKAVWDEVGVVEEVLDEVLGTGELPTQKKSEIVAASGTTLSASADKYYKFSADVDTLAVTLNHSSSTYIQTIVFGFTAGTTPAVTFAPAVSGESIYYADGFAIEAGKTYEVNALWNGTNWMVALLNIVVS